jgi:ribosome-associated toxin RatA of RatAB toxin-antitoxin module
MVEHSASVTVKATVHQVYALFTHFNDFPKFMSFVKEVTYYDEQRSHWAVQVGREYEWDAVNEDWIVDQQVGWRSTNGLRNAGRVKFRALGPERTSVDVYLQYTPPTGTLGGLGEALGMGAYFDSVLQKDLTHFARMVEEAPAGALDPMSSHYLFHDDSATRKGQITSRQKVAMENDPMMRPETLAERQASIEHEAMLRRQKEQENEEARKRKLELEHSTMQQRQVLLEEGEIKRRQEQRTREETQKQTDATPLDPRHVYAATARGLGDKDGLRARDPNLLQDPMTSRRPTPSSSKKPAHKPPIRAE